MSRFAKILVLIEVAVCFGPITLMLLAGIYLVISRPGDPGLIFVAILSMGVAGLVGVFCVVRWLLIRPASSWNATVVLILICLGCVPVLMYTPRGWHTLDRLVFSLPLICTVHLGYLARDYLFASLSLSGR